MAMPGFGGGQPARGIDSRQLVQFREVEPAYAGACTGEQLQGALEGGCHIGIELVEDQIPGNGQAQPG